MTLPRSQQIDLELTPYYHCVSRCVRRAFLCGEDRWSGRNFEHRRAWLVDRLKTVAEVFAIDICAYAVMSNHFHLVVRVVPERAQGWTDEEIVARVSRVFPSALVGLADVPIEQREKTIAVWRGRLTSLSWVMRCLNEWLARRANREDKCKGRFWEGRFYSQALLDIGAVLACMSYVDLNPVRAGLATTLADSDFTSIGERLRAITAAAKKNRGQPTAPAGLAPMMGERTRTGRNQRLDLSLRDYVEIVDWTGRAIRPDKSGAVTGAPPQVMTNVGLNPDTWAQNVVQWGRRMGGVVGRPDATHTAATRRGVRWCKGRRNAARLYRET